MYGSILLENIPFSRNCDTKINKSKSVTDASPLEVFISKKCDTLEIKLSQLIINSPIIIPRYGFRFRLTDLADKAHS